MKEAPQIGARINARLSDYNLSRLTPQQQRAARALIRKLRRTQANLTDAEGTYQGMTIAVRRGRLYLNGHRAPFYMPSNATVGETICELVSRAKAPAQGETLATAISSETMASRGETLPAAKAQTAKAIHLLTEEAPKMTPEEIENLLGPDPEKEKEQEPTEENTKPDEESSTSQTSSRPANDYDYLRAELRRFREFSTAREQEHADDVSLRAFENGCKMIRAGLPVEAALHAYCLTWPEAARQACKVPTFEPAGWGGLIDGHHESFNYIKAVAEARIPIALIGPAGAGKGHLTEQLAQSLGLGYGSTPLAEGALPGWLLGSYRPEVGYVSSQFVDCYHTGRVWLGDEMDAAESAILIAVNDAIARNRLSNPTNNTIYDKHENFVPVANMNTTGTGADSKYGARKPLDWSIIDRWRMGRVMVGYDARLEDSIVDGFKERA